MSDQMPSEQIIKLIEGQARLESKIDQFLRDQTRHDNDISMIRRDVDEMKSTLGSYGTYLKAASAFLAVAWIPVTLFVVPYIQKILGI